MLNDIIRHALNDIVNALENLQLDWNHHDEIAAIREHLEAAEHLDGIGTRSRSFTATAPDASTILARLIAGDDVPDDELISYAVRANAAGQNIGNGAVNLTHTAQSARLRAAREILRGVTEEILKELRALLPSAGDKPTEAFVRTVTGLLKDLNDTLGRNVDYWLLHNHRKDVWVILARDEAETLNLANDDYVAEQQRLARERKALGPKHIRAVAGQPSRFLRRTPMVGSGAGGTPPTADEVAAYQATKDAHYYSPRPSLSREDLARELPR